MTAIIAMRPNDEKKTKPPVPTLLSHFEQAKAQQVKQPGPYVKNPVKAKPILAAAIRSNNSFGIANSVSTKAVNAFALVSA